MMPYHLAIIGFGAIAQTLLDLLVAQRLPTSTRLSLLCRPHAVAAAQDWLARHWSGPAAVMTTTEDLRAAEPDLVVECAGQDAICEHVVPLLAGGIECVLVSSGALADEALHFQVLHAAERGATRAVVASGAVGGLDILGVHRQAGIAFARYVGRKPPQAWRGSVAEMEHDLDNLVGPCLLFEGNAREAARRFPKNANVAATIALAGAGFEATSVCLFADPGLTENLHEIEVRSPIGSVELRLEGRSLPGQPRSSAATAYSVLREILNRSAAISI